MNNKSKVIHEIEILLIVGNELLKNFQRLRFSQLHNVLNCTFAVFLCSYALHCFSIQQTSFCFLSSWAWKHKHNWFHYSAFPWTIRDVYQCFQSHKRVTILHDSHQPLQVDCLYIISRKKPFGAFYVFVFSAITSEMDIKFCCFAEFFSFWRRILMVQNGLCAWLCVHLRVSE